MPDQVWQVNIRARDQFSRVIERGTDRSIRGVRNLEREVNDTDRAMGRMGRNTSGMRNFNSEARGVRATLSDVGSMITGFQSGLQIVEGIGRQLGEINELGAEANKADRSFVQLTRGIGGANNVLEKLRHTTRGSVDDMTLQSGANMLLGIGIAKTAEQVRTLTADAALLGSAFGKDAKESIEDFSLMMANESVQRLDTFGISAAAVRRRMQELQATGEALTRSEAFQIATVEQIEVTKQRLGDVEHIAITSAGKVQAQFQNMAQDFGQYVNQNIETLAQNWLDITDFVTGAQERIQLAAQGREQLFGMQFGQPQQQPAQPLRQAFTETGFDMGEAFRQAIESPNLGASMGKEFANAFKQDLPGVGSAGERLAGFSYGENTFAQILTDMQTLVQNIRETDNINRQRWEQQRSMQGMPAGFFEAMEASTAWGDLSNTFYPLDPRVSPDTQRSAAVGMRQGEIMRGYWADPSRQQVPEEVAAAAQVMANESAAAMLEFKQYNQLVDEWNRDNSELGTNLQNFASQYKHAAELLEQMQDQPFVPASTEQNLMDTVTNLDGFLTYLEDLNERGALGALGDTWVTSAHEAVEVIKEGYREAGETIKNAADVSFAMLTGMGRTQQGLGQHGGMLDYFQSVVGGNVISEGLGGMLGRSSSLTEYLESVAELVEAGVEMGREGDVFAATDNMLDRIRFMRDAGDSFDAIGEALRAANDLGFVIMDQSRRQGRNPFMEMNQMSPTYDPRGINEFTQAYIAGRPAPDLSRFQLPGYGQGRNRLLGMNQMPAFDSSLMDEFTQAYIAARPAPNLTPFQLPGAGQGFNRLLDMNMGSGHDYAAETAAVEASIAARQREIEVTRAAAAETERLTNSLAALAGQESGGAFGEALDKVLGFLPEDMQGGAAAAFDMASGRENIVSQALDQMYETVAAVVTETSPQYGAQLVQDMLEAAKQSRLAGGSDYDIAAAARGAVPYTGGAGRSITVAPGMGRWALEQKYGQLSDEEWGQITDSGGGLHPGTFQLGGGGGFQFTGGWGSGERGEAPDDAPIIRYGTAVENASENIRTFSDEMTDVIDNAVVLEDTLNQITDIEMDVDTTKIEAKIQSLVTEALKLQKILGGLPGAGGGMTPVHLGGDGRSGAQITVP